MSDDHKLIQKALNFSYFYLKFRARTRREIELYLQKKAEKYGFTPEVITMALEKLEELHFVNDSDFIKMYVESRSKRNSKGELALRNELTKLGIQKDLLDEFFLENPLDQDTQARQALESKWYRFAALDNKKRFEKAAAFLSRRGFTFDVIKKTIAEMEQKEYNMS